METGFLPYRHSTIHYYRFGHGPEWLLCFHGYGEDGNSFAILETLLGDRFSLIAIDFPFHGKTDWKEGLLFDIPDLLAIIGQLKPREQPARLLGYSMGGRVALQVLQTIPEQVTALVLVAPDGLHKNKWQWLSTKTLIGNRLFAYFMKNPGFLLSFLNRAAQVGLYNKSLVKFVHYYLDDAEQRSILYRRWTTMRKFRPDTVLLKKTIIAHAVHLHLLFGKYDRIILPIHGIAFSRKTKGLVRVTEIESGHQLLREKHAMLIAELITG